ncbi:MAG TPA: peptide chain release factor 1 [Actinomycetota bacterium]|nr:peptide chain release factor 1 [Actinomycetota bacterium]
MYGRMSEIDARYQEVQSKLMDPNVTSRPDLLRQLGKENAELEPTVLTYRRWRAALGEVDSARRVLDETSDPEMKEMAEMEISDQQSLADKLEEELKVLLIPTDPNDDKDVIVEVKAGEGGDESALFAGELFRMYENYAEKHGWKTEVLSSTPSNVGGFKDVTFAVKGKGAYSRMKHEAGVHRVQRVPETESQGRLHTSAVGVVVMPEAEEVEVQIDPKDLKWDVFRSSGPGGQSVNTTDSAVRLTHLPTNTVISCQDEKSQLQNRDKALRILRARLHQKELDRRASEESAARKGQVRSVDRSEKIRTYNFPQNRVTDHRVKVSVHNVPEVMGGGLDPFIDALITKTRTEQLAGDPAG